MPQRERTQVNPRQRVEPRRVGDLITGTEHSTAQRIFLGESITQRVGQFMRNTGHTHGLRQAMRLAELSTKFKMINTEHDLFTGRDRQNHIACHVIRTNHTVTDFTVD